MASAVRSFLHGRVFDQERSGLGVRAGGEAGASSAGQLGARRVNGERLFLTLIDESLFPDSAWAAPRHACLPLPAPSGWGWGDMVVLGRQTATRSLKMSFVEVGRERDVRRAELALLGDVLQPCDGLAWLQFGMSRMGSGMDALSISLQFFSAGIFESHLSYCDLPWGFKDISSSIVSPSCKTPWSKEGRLLWAQTPVLVSCWAFGGAGGWWAASSEPGCSLREGERAWVVASAPSSPVSSGGQVT